MRATTALLRFDEGSQPTYEGLKRRPGRGTNDRGGGFPAYL